MTIGRFPKSRQFSLKPNLTAFGQIAKVQYYDAKPAFLHAAGETSVVVAHTPCGGALRPRYLRQL
jgi:hypothetical protein